MLVKVGEGLWSLVKADLSKQDRVGLLEALAGTRAFEVSLLGVPLDKCAVRVCTSASKKAPSDQEAAAVRELEGADTLGDVTADLVNNLFIHVQLPSSAGAGAAGAGSGGESMTRN